MLATYIIFGIILSILILNTHDDYPYDFYDDDDDQDNDEDDYDDDDNYFYTRF